LDRDGNPAPYKAVQTTSFAWGSKMSKRVLLLEPYDVVAAVITDLLDQLGYAADVVTSGSIDKTYLQEKSYHCVLVNLDQNRTEWQDYGLRLAQMASDLGIPVIMIPDHETAAQMIDAKGWLRISKPFTMANLQKVIERAVGDGSPAFEASEAKAEETDPRARRE
jgi:DNA-binding NtrC family response regulator